MRGVLPIGRMVATVLMMSIAQDGAAEEALRSGMGHLTAFADEKPLASGSRLTIEPGPGDPELGTDPLYVSARAAIGRELAKRGISVVENAALTLRLRIRLIEPGSPPPGPIVRFPAAAPPFEDPGGTPTVVDQVQIPLGGQAGPASARISIAFLLFRSGGAPAWTATIAAAGEFDAPAALVAKLTKAAMGAFGDDAERDFVLSCGGAPQGAGGVCLE